MAEVGGITLLTKKNNASSGLKLIRLRIKKWNWPTVRSEGTGRESKSPGIITKRKSSDQELKKACVFMMKFEPLKVRPISISDA